MCGGKKSLTIYNLSVIKIMAMPKKKILFFVSVIGLLLGGIVGILKLTNTLTWPEALESYLGPAAYKSVDPDKPLHEQTSVFEIAGRVFEVPTVYIQSNLGGKRLQPDGVNLIYVLPGYTSRADFANRQQYEDARREGRFAFMLLEPEEGRPLFDTVIQNRKRRLGKVENAEPFQGLEVEKWYMPDGDKLVFYYEVFLEKSAQGHVISWIECSTIERAPISICSHRFRDKGLLYKISYHKNEYLADWQGQRDSAIKFINGFETTDKNTLTEED